MLQLEPILVASYGCAAFACLLLLWTCHLAVYSRHGHAEWLRLLKASSSAALCGQDSIEMAGCWHVVCCCCVRAAGHASEAHAHQLEQQLDAANLAKAQLAREVRYR